MNAAARLLLAIRAVVVAGLFGAGPNVSEAGEPPSQPSAATSPVTANAQPAANTSGKKVLVDDTVTDAQLKQILAKGYKPESQARGHEVYYCRGQHETGSRFETKVCKTAARILLEERQGKEATSDLERTAGNKAVK